MKKHQTRTSGDQKSKQEERKRGRGGREETHIYEHKLNTFN